MPDTQKFPKLSTEDACREIPAWSPAPGRAKPSIFRTYTFGSFADAFAFMTSGALLAERMDHHPDWRNTYKQVKVLLTTHSAGGVTTLDVEMAKAFDAIAEKLGVS